MSISSGMIVCHFALAVLLSPVSARQEIFPGVFVSNHRIPSSTTTTKVMDTRTAIPNTSEITITTATANQKDDKDREDKEEEECDDWFSLPSSKGSNAKATKSHDYGRKDSKRSKEVKYNGYKGSKSRFRILKEFKSSSRLSMARTKNGKTGNNRHPSRHHRVDHRHNQLHKQMALTKKLCPTKSTKKKKKKKDHRPSGQPVMFENVHTPSQHDAKSAATPSPPISFHTRKKERHDYSRTRIEKLMRSKSSRDKSSSSKDSISTKGDHKRQVPSPFHFKPTRSKKKKKMDKDESTKGNHKRQSPSTFHFKPTRSKKEKNVDKDESTKGDHKRQSPSTFRFKPTRSKKEKNVGKDDDHIYYKKKRKSSGTRNKQDRLRKPHWHLDLPQFPFLIHLPWLPHRHLYLDLPQFPFLIHLPWLPPQQVPPYRFLPPQHRQEIHPEPSPHGLRRRDPPETRPTCQRSLLLLLHCRYLPIHPFRKREVPPDRPHKTRLAIQLRIQQEIQLRIQQEIRPEPQQLRHPLVLPHNLPSHPSQPLSPLPFYRVSLA